MLFPFLPTGRQVPLSFKKKSRRKTRLFIMYEPRSECFQNIIHASYGLCAFIEEGLFFLVQFVIKDLFPSILPDHYRNTQADIFLPVLAIKRHAAGEKTFLVAYDAFH